MKTTHRLLWFDGTIYSYSTNHKETSEEFYLNIFNQFSNEQGFWDYPIQETIYKSLKKQNDPYIRAKKALSRLRSRN